MSFGSLLARLRRAASKRHGEADTSPLDTDALFAFEAGTLAAEDLPPPWCDMLAAASAPPAECPLERLIRLAGDGLSDDEIDDTITPEEQQ